MVFKHFLVGIALLFLACNVLAYYPYGPEIRIYGTDTYLRTPNYSLAYTNYYPQTYTVYAGPYAAYTGFYYKPASFAAYPSYYYGNYWPQYYNRGYPEATDYIVYSGGQAPYAGPAGYSRTYYGSDYASGASASYTTTAYSGYSTCSESYCVRLN